MCVKVILEISNKVLCTLRPSHYIFLSATIPPLPSFPSFLALDASDFIIIPLIVVFIVASIFQQGNKCEKCFKRGSLAKERECYLSAVKTWGEERKGVGERAFQRARICRVHILKPSFNLRLNSFLLNGEIIPDEEWKGSLVAIGQM